MILSVLITIAGGALIAALCAMAAEPIITDHLPDLRKEDRRRT